MVRNYVASYSISLSQLYILSDGDGDGLGDESEALIGSSISQDDTDHDGVSDWSDVQPQVRNEVGIINTTEMLCCEPLSISLHCSIDKQSTVVSIVNPQNSFFTLSGFMADKILWRNLSLVTSSSLPTSQPWSPRTISPLESTTIIVSQPPPVIIAPSLLLGFIVDAADQKFEWNLSQTVADSCSESDEVSWSFAPPAEVSAYREETENRLVLSFSPLSCGSFPIAVKVNSSFQERLFSIPLHLYRRSPSPLVNEDFEGRVDAGDGFMKAPPGWTFWQWEGVYAIEHTRRAAFSGNSSFLIDGKASGKAGIYQVRVVESVLTLLTCSSQGPCAGGRSVLVELHVGVAELAGQRLGRNGGGSGGEGRWVAHHPQQIHGGELRVEENISALSYLLAADSDYVPALFRNRSCLVR
eukprot:748065-Hanusia_phi.AAC.3